MPENNPPYVPCEIGFVIQRSHREGDVTVIDEAELVETSIREEDVPPELKPRIDAGLRLKGPDGR